MTNRLYVLCLLAIFCQTSNIKAEEMSIEIIPLQYRSVDDVVDILRPLVTPGGTVTGMNNQLVIKTTPGNLVDLKKVLRNLDYAARRLLITVKQDIKGQMLTSEDSLSGRYSSGDVTVSSHDPGHTRDGLVISSEDSEGNSIRYRTQDSHSSIDDKNTFQVQVLEGHHAFIHTGQSVPVSTRTAVVTPDGGVVVTDNTEFHDATSGFYVLPRLAGDKVTLLIAPRLSRVTPGKRPTFDVQNVETTASGRLGEWIRIGGINQNQQGGNRQNFSSAEVQGKSMHAVLVKVDEILQ